MLRAGLIFVAALVVAVGAGALFIVLAIRTKSPRGLRVVRRFNRDVGNKLQRRSAGRAGAWAAVIQHRGRTSGRTYETPVVPFATDGGFLISLPYGVDTDWLKNVLASGTAVLVSDGNTYTVGRPEVLATADVRDEFPPKEQRTHRRFRIDRCLRLHVVEANGAPEPATDGGSEG
jgi:hypothetical protein